MDYYHKKAIAYRLIEQMYYNGYNSGEIEISIARNYGFGSKMVQNYLTLLEKNPPKQPTQPIDKETMEDLDNVFTAQPVGPSQPEDRIDADGKDQ